MDWFSGMETSTSFESQSKKSLISGILLLSRVYISYYGTETLLEITTGLILSPHTLKNYLRT